MATGLIFSLRVSTHRGLNAGCWGKGKQLRVLSPRILVEDMKQTVKEMIDKYR